MLYWFGRSNGLYSLGDFCPVPINRKNVFQKKVHKYTFCGFVRRIVLDIRVL